MLTAVSGNQANFLLTFKACFSPLTLLGDPITFHLCGVNVQGHDLGQFVTSLALQCGYLPLRYLLATIARSTADVT